MDFIWEWQKCYKWLEISLKNRSYLARLAEWIILILRSISKRLHWSYVIYFRSVLRHYLKFITYIQVDMNTKLIYTTMSQASLYLDELTIDEIKKFIDTFVGHAWITNPQLCIYVCASIVCQCKRLPAIQSNLVVPFGLNVEIIMKLCPQALKQQFLNSIIITSQKWSACPPQFLHKVGNLKFNLRIFNKYRLSCKLIGEKLNLNQNSNHLLSSLFWVIYLIAKTIFSDSDSLEVITLIVPYLIGQIYLFYLRRIQRSAIQASIQQYFSAPTIRNQNQNQLLQKYRREFLKILSDSYRKRYLVQLTSFDFLIYRPSILERLIDDLSNIYAKMLECSPQFSIDEASFLDLRKDKTPEGFQQRISKDGNQINSKLYFDKEKSVQQQIQGLNIRGQENSRIQNLEQTPLSIRMQNMAWIRNCIEGLQQRKLQRVEVLYQKFNKGKFNQFYDKILSLLQIVINEFSPACKDLNRRKKQIYKFFVYIIDIAIEMYHEEVKKIFQGDHLIISIFSLCTSIFNFVYQTYSGSYSKYCEIFNVDFVNAFWPINWFGYYIKLPKAVEDHLYLLQRRFLLKQIWVTDLGFKIITNHQQVVRINQLRMLQRLKHHIRYRIEQICRQTIGQKMIGKINNLVIQLIQKKPHLLKRNNIDQIIICSIAACLSINEDGNRLSLQKIFRYYQKVSLSSIQNKEKLYDNDQNQQNIVDFYNNVFLGEIEDIIRNSLQQNNFLLTPRRLQFVEKYKQGVESTPLKQKYKENESAFWKKIGEVHQGSTYQYNMARNIKMESEQAMVEQKDEEMQEKS